MTSVHGTSSDLIYTGFILLKLTLPILQLGSLLSLYSGFKPESCSRSKNKNSSFIIDIYMWIHLESLVNFSRSFSKTELDVNFLDKSLTISSFAYTLIITSVRTKYELTDVDHETLHINFCVGLTIWPSLVVTARRWWLNLQSTAHRISCCRSSNHRLLTPMKNRYETWQPGEFHWFSGK